MPTENEVIFGRTQKPVQFRPPTFAPSKSTLTLKTRHLCPAQIKNQLGYLH